MTLVVLNIKKSWTAVGLIDFLTQFELETKAKKYYNVEDLEDIYESDNYTDDDFDMKYWLGILDGNYTFNYVEEQHCEYWRIDKINKYEVLK